MFEDQPRQFDPGANVELAEDLPQVKVDGVTGHEQPAGDLRVGEAFGDDRGDLAFRGGQAQPTGGRAVGAIPINFEQTNPIDKIMEDTGGKGADRGCECVGYQATDAQGSEHPNITLNNLVNSVKFAGTIGVVGVYVARDPKHPDPLYQHHDGEVAFDFGEFWTRGQTMGTGQCNVKNYNRQLLALIVAGKAHPSFVVSHELSLEQAPTGYEHFDKREQGWTKVLMHPDGGR